MLKRGTFYAATTADGISVVLEFFKGKKGDVVSVFRGKVVLPKFRALPGNKYPVLLFDAGRAWIAYLDKRYTKPAVVVTDVIEDENGSIGVFYHYGNVFEVAGVILGVSLGDRALFLRLPKEERGRLKEIIKEKTGFTPVFLFQ